VSLHPAGMCDFSFPRIPFCILFNVSVYVLRYVLHII
jgi:hypothetical protein